MCYTNKRVLPCGTVFQESKTGSRQPAPCLIMILPEGIRLKSEET